MKRKKKRAIDMGSKVSREVINNQLNQMTAEILTSIQLKCASDTINRQIISVDCQNAVNLTTAYENNSTCRSCILDILTRKQQEYAQYIVLAENGKPNLNIPNINLDLLYVSEQMQACGKNFCKACVLEDISQSNMVDVNVNCNATNNITNQVQQSLTTSITQKLSTDYDIFGSIANVIGGKDAQSVVNNISNRVKTVITDTLITNIYSQVKSNQDINIKTTSTATVRNVSQVSTYSSIVKYLGDNSIFNSIISNAEIKSLQKLYDTNNSISSVGNAFNSVNSIFADMLSGVTGYVLLAIFICMGIAVVTVVTMTIYQWRKVILGTDKQTLRRMERYQQVMQQSNNMSYGHMKPINFPHLFSTTQQKYVLHPQESEFRFPTAFRK
jgi:hypothetical protein